LPIVAGIEEMGASANLGNNVQQAACFGSFRQYLATVSNNGVVCGGPRFSATGKCRFRVFLECTAVTLPKGALQRYTGNIHRFSNTKKCNYA